MSFWPGLQIHAATDVSGDYTERNVPDQHASLTQSYDTISIFFLKAHMKYSHWFNYLK